MPSRDACTAPRCWPGHRDSSARFPAELLDEVRPRVQVSRPVYGGAGSAYAAPVADTLPVALGSRVSHPSFGEGVVVSAEGGGSHTRIQVNFTDAGSKWLVLAYANLTPL